MPLTPEQKVEPIIAIINVLSEFVTKTMLQITIAVGNLNQRTDRKDYPDRADFNTLKEAIAAKVDTKLLIPLDRYKKQIETNKDSYPLPVYREIMAIIELEENKWKQMQTEILALSLKQAARYQRKLYRLRSQHLSHLDKKIKPGLEAEMDKIREGS